MKHRFLCATGAALLAVGCSMGPNSGIGSTLTADDLAHLDEPLECATETECARLWRRVQAWIASNAGMKIQVATDVVIETYTPPAYSGKWGYQATRIPLDGTRERINLVATCGRPGCSGSDAKMTAAFRRAMRAAP